MSIKDRYQAYADAFEVSFEDDDWSRIEPFFTEDAVYAGGDAEAVGRDQILEKFKTDLATFDRRMDARIPDFQEPAEAGNEVTSRWTVTYQKAGAPDLVITGLETATFEGDRIAHLRDDFDPETAKQMGEWFAAHGAKLQGG